MKLLNVEEVQNGFLVHMQVLPDQAITAETNPSFPVRIIVPKGKINAVVQTFLSEGGTMQKAAEAVGE